MAISIIVPVLNEAAQIQATLRSLTAPQSTDLSRNNELEIIVVDGGSSDHTGEIARSLGARVIGSPPGRANQMNRGAAVATKNVLLFLHADTRLPSNYPTLVEAALATPTTAAGAFELKIDAPGRLLRFVERMVNWRSRLLSLPYGDQALFLRADVFKDVGGFASLPIMEDFELVRRLQQRGRIHIVPAAVLTSARRWQKLGIIRTTLINQVTIAGYFLGIPPATLARWYRAPQARRTGERGKLLRNGKKVAPQREQGTGERGFD
ncbi:MAG: TIGR04283 family arsenosugar biosynthesis glycosyltransferase [Cyanophyceae cyanobacterium]